MSDISFQDIKQQLEKWYAPEYIYPEDIPSIELYMDQITTFMDKQLGGNKRRDEDKILTKTMINNYSKNNLLPPSDRKKYSKDHIILLIYIYYLKNFLSINDIQNLLTPMTDNYFQKADGITMSDIYKSLFKLGQKYGVHVRESIQEIYDIASGQFEPSDDYLKTYAMITLLSYDIYAKKQLVERLIDSLQESPVSKAELKEARELVKQKEKEEKQRLKNNGKNSSKPQ
ncbi:MAG: DUF1836 domain-containing protein [Bacteroidales bacterium]|nr:DUF1836 domain-containing protein [Clostridium sp.]MCM1202991.1 DUF1836 domain-containing protein [Bacteroidales bacterium]